MAQQIYNPLLKLGLQELQDIPEPPAPITVDDKLSPTSTNPVQNKVITAKLTEMEQDTRKKVSKFFASIEELEIGEIGEYQGETNETFTRGFFYERGSGTPAQYEDITIQSGSKKIIYTNKFDSSQRVVYAFDTIQLPSSVVVNYAQGGPVYLLDDVFYDKLKNTANTIWILNETSLVPIDDTTYVYSLYETLRTLVTGQLLTDIQDLYNIIKSSVLNAGFRTALTSPASLGRITDLMMIIYIPLKFDNGHGTISTYDATRYILISDLAALNWNEVEYISQYYSIEELQLEWCYDRSRPIAYQYSYIVVTITNTRYVFGVSRSSGQTASELYQTVSEDGEQSRYIDINHKLCVFDSEPTSEGSYWAQNLDVDIYFNYNYTIQDTTEAITIHRKIQQYDEYGFPISEQPTIIRRDTQPSLNPANFATSEQGEKADTALQSISKGTDGDYITTTIGAKNANNNQTVGVSAQIQDIATADNTHKGFAESSDVKAYAATAAQGAKADTALQSIAHGTDGNYVTSHIGSKDANNVQTVDVALQLQAVETADVSHKGVAEANDVKEYVSKSIASYIPYNPIYGVMWDTSDPSPECVRIGNLDLHRTLPVQSQMVGGTLTDAGVFTPFASVDDWTQETRDGSAGQVMVRLPQYFWIKFITEGTVCKVLMSAEEVSGFVKVPLYYISAYKAALQRSTLKLASVVNTDADFRGGNNQAAWDSTYRSLLGYPATSISLTDFRTYARNRAAGTEWNCAVYEIHKLLYWLFVVEYATLNTQKDYNAALDANGYHQGGLGVGVTDWSGDAWNSFNGYYPLIPCGYTDEYGNQTAQQQYNLYGSDGTTILHRFQVPRYRGVESAFGDIWEWTDGVLIPKQADSAGGKSPVYVTSDPAKFSSNDYSQYDYVCDEIRAEGFIKSLYFGDNGDLICTAIPGSSASYYCDYWYGANLPSSGVSLRALLFGGAAHSGARAGFVCGNSHNGPGDVFAGLGSRLCFIPNTV